MDVGPGRRGRVARPSAAKENSSLPRLRSVLRHVLLGLSVLACVLLLLGELGDLNEVVIGDTPRNGQSVGGNDGYALVLVAFVAAIMAFGAWRTGSLPAAFAVAGLGAVSVLVVLSIHAPDVNAVGTFGEDYEDVTASAAGGFYLVTAGAVLLLFAGVLTAYLRPAAAPAPGASGPRERPSRS